MASGERAEVLHFQKSVYLSFSGVSIQLYLFVNNLDFVYVETDVLNLAGFLDLQQCRQTYHEYFC